MSDSTIQILEGMLGYGNDADEEISLVNSMAGLNATVSLSATPGSFDWGKLKWPLIGLAGAAAAFLGYRWWQKRALRASASVGTMSGYPGRRTRRNKRRKSRKSRR